jgi:hypothetical protein
LFIVNTLHLNQRAPARRFQSQKINLEVARLRQSAARCVGHIGGISSEFDRHPEQQWMEQMGRNVTMQKWGFLANSRYLLHDRDSKFCPSFRQLIEAGRVKTMPLPARSPNLNAYAERWVRSVKQECLSKLILFGERPLRRALQQYVAHYHEERNHQGKQNRLLFPLPNRRVSGDSGIVRCKERLGGLLKYYEREAA